MLHIFISSRIQGSTRGTSSTVTKVLNEMTEHTFLTFGDPQLNQI
jgi:hypothetical protein